MTRQNLRTLGALGVLFVLIAVVIGVFVPDDGKTRNAGASGSGGTPSGESCNKQEVVRGILVSAGFTADQFTIGEENFNLSLPAAQDAGNGRFADQPLTTVGALTSFVGSGAPAANKLLDTTVTLSGGTREQAVDPSNWVGFQLLTRSEWSGNTLFVNGQVTPAGTRHSAEGDIGWVFINPSDCSTRANVVRVAIVRLACGNPQTVAPNPPGTPPPAPTPTSTPTTRPTPTTTPTPTTVPCPSGKCTPATPVAPPPTMAPPATSTTQPSNGGQGDSGDGATNTTSPPPTESPAPAPDRTESPTENPSGPPPG